MLLALLLGLTAAGANVLGGSLIAHRQWSHNFLKYFIALGAGFIMLATALLEMIPESLKLRGGVVFERARLSTIRTRFSSLVLAGYFLVHSLRAYNCAAFSFWRGDASSEEISHAHASYAALLGLVIHTFFDGVAIASGLAGFGVARERPDFHCDLFCTSCRRGSRWRR